MQIKQAKAKLALLAGLSVLPFTASPAGAIGFVYNYVGGNSGFSGQLVLDASAGTGGSVADILSGSLTTPQFGTVSFNSATADSISAFNWTASAITAMDIYWSNGILDSRVVATSPTAGSVSQHVGETSGLVPGGNAIDTHGHWVSASVPDAAGTSGLLLISLGALGVGHQARRRATA